MGPLRLFVVDVIFDRFQIPIKKFNSLFSHFIERFAHVLLHNFIFINKSGAFVVCKFACMTTKKQEPNVENALKITIVCFQLHSSIDS